MVSFKKNKKRKKLRGGAVNLSVTAPNTQNVSANGAIQQAMNKQKLNSLNMVKLSKDMAGGSKMMNVPQMSQAGGTGNSLMKAAINLQLQTRAKSEYDGQALMGRSQGVAGMTGGRKSRKKRRKRRKIRKTKKRTKSRKRRKSRRRKK